MATLQKIKSFALITLPLLHWTTAQQPAQYNQRIIQADKTQLEDLERENYKNPSSAQDAYPVQSNQAAHQNQLPVYAATQNSIPFLLSPQQQYLFQQPYIAPQSYPFTLDLANLPLAYLANMPAASSLYQPYYLPQVSAGANQLLINPSVTDYFKSSTLQQQQQQQQTTATTGQKTSLSPVTSLKAIPSAQSSGFQNYLIPQQYYQQPSYNQLAQSASPYFYNTLFQSQYPQKNVYTSGIKSTTPSAPVKDTYVPISDTSYRFEYPHGEQSTGFSKVRLTG